MTFEVRWSDDLLTTIAYRFPPERTAAGGPSEYDFHGGPLPDE